MRIAKLTMSSTLLLTLAACGQVGSPVTPSTSTGSSVRTGPTDVRPANLPQPYTLSSTPSHWRGMTWRVHDQGNGVVHVGRDEVTNPYQGDSSVDSALPILCLNPDGRPVPDGVPLSEYHGWAHGEVKLTQKVIGRALTSNAMADRFCSTEFGQGWRMAEFHDGKLNGQTTGWNFYANGTLSTDSRFWVAINDQNANPWNTNGFQPDAIIPTTTKVLGAQDRAGIIYADDYESYVILDASSPILTTLAPGDTLASAPAPAIPYGLLRKVTSIQPYTNGQVLLYTSEGNIEDAVEDGDLEAGVNLSSADIDYARSGSEIGDVQVGLAAQSTFTLAKFNKSVGCVVNLNTTTSMMDCSKGAIGRAPANNKVTLEGTLHADAKAFINLKIRRFAVQNFDAGVEANQKTQLALKATVGTSYKKDIHFDPIDLTEWGIEFKPITFTVGFVPVVVTPVLTPTVGISGSINGTIEYKLTSEFKRRMGIQWVRGSGWGTINTGSNTVLEDEFLARAAAKIRGEVGVRAELALYKVPKKDIKVAGVWVNPKVYVEGNGEFNTVPGTGESYSICIKGGAEMKFGANLPKIIREKPYESSAISLLAVDFKCWNGNNWVERTGNTQNIQKVELRFREVYDNSSVNVDRNGLNGYTAYGSVYIPTTLDISNRIDPSGDARIKLGAQAKKDWNYRWKLHVDLMINGAVVDSYDGNCYSCGSRGEIVVWQVNKTTGDWRAVSKFNP